MAQFLKLEAQVKDMRRYFKAYVKTEARKRHRAALCIQRAFRGHYSRLANSAAVTRLRTLRRQRMRRAKCDTQQRVRVVDEEAPHGFAQHVDAAVAHGEDVEVSVSISLSPMCPLCHL